jgi:hypothetical protein
LSPRFSLEFQLACACCRVKPSERDRAEMTRLLPLVDVPAFLELVITRHRIGPLVHAALSHLQLPAWPEGLLAPLAGETRHNAFKALRAIRTQVLLERWFREAQIPWLPFKGITVAQRYYGQVALRQVNDQDVWVPGSHLAAARAVLAGHNFDHDIEIGHSNLADRGPRHQAFLADYYFEELHRSDECGLIELHWELAETRSQFNVAPEEILRRADRLAIGGTSVPVMGHVDLLLYLCDHGSRHNWFRLKWLADLPQLLEQPNLRWDWPDVLARARRAGCLRSLLSSLILAEDLFGWVPPPEVARAMRRDARLAVAVAVARAAMRSAPETVWSTDKTPLGWSIRIAASKLALASSLRSVAHQMWRRSISPKDLELLPLPDGWFWLYRFARPLLFAWRRCRVWFPSR